MLEKNLERLMYASRWLLAPVYLGMSLALLALGIKFFQEVLEVLPHILEIDDANLILQLLSLIDLTLVGSLKIFMNIEHIDNDKLLWYVSIHLTLVLSALLMGFLDKLTKHV